MVMFSTEEKNRNSFYPIIFYNNINQQVRFLFEKDH